jgi:hypothetical protein
MSERLSSVESTDLERAFLPQPSPNIHYSVTAVPAMLQTWKGIGFVDQTRFPWRLFNGKINKDIRRNGKLFYASEETVCLCVRAGGRCDFLEQVLASNFPQSDISFKIRDSRRLWHSKEAVNKNREIILFRELPYSELLRCEWWQFGTYVLGQPIGPIFKVQESKRKPVTLRWDFPVVCYKYHKNEAESQSEHN